MEVAVFPAARLSGEITAPPSKAQSHRALAAGLLSKGKTSILNPLVCDDTQASAGAVESFGAKITKSAGLWEVHGTGRPKQPTGEIDCGESGVTLRFMLPIAALTGASVTFAGKASLMNRPLEPLTNAIAQLGAKVSVSSNKAQVEGERLVGGEAKIPGNISSQFISGLLFAGPLMSKGLSLALTSPLESEDYVKLTLQVLRQHEIRVTVNQELSSFEISPQEYSPATHHVTGDYSSAAFPLAAGAITNSKIVVRGLSQNDTEPDGGLLEIFRRIGVDLSVESNSVGVDETNLKGVTIDIKNNPDLGPVLAALGCYAKGETRIEGAARLRYKESDRLRTISSELRALGGNITEGYRQLTVQGPARLKGGIVNSHGDHRIAMALSVAALGASDKVIIKDAECVSKSYPSFYGDLRTLGATVVG